MCLLTLQHSELSDSLLVAVFNCMISYYDMMVNGCKMKELLIGSAINDPSSMCCCFARRRLFGSFTCGRKTVYFLWRFCSHCWKWMARVAAIVAKLVVCKPLLSMTLWRRQILVLFQVLLMWTYLQLAIASKFSCLLMWYGDLPHIFCLFLSTFVVIVYFISKLCLRLSYFVLYSL